MENDLNKIIRLAASNAVKELFNADNANVQLQKTRKDFVGDITLVCFPLTSISKKSPEETGNAIGEYLKTNIAEVKDYNVVKGFLNIEMTTAFWLNSFDQIVATEQYGIAPSNGKVVVVEYCGPNTNKPLHVGHLRNMFLGYSIAEILKANGYKVHKVNILNDRGVAICKSMLAYQKWGNGKTPESVGLKADHFIGDFYVSFGKEEKKQIDALIAEGIDPKEAARKAPILLEAQTMLQKWEDGDAEVRALWQLNNKWCLQGHQQTYDSLGIDFEKNYAESDYYLSGKQIVKDGVKSGAYIHEDDGSIQVDLTDDGLDKKVLLRKDGTSVYLTQDLGVAEARYKDFGMDKSIYVVGDEQNYHFKVLQLALQKLGKSYADGIYHLSYGMVDLPSGRMKTREGTVIDADELVAEMLTVAEQRTKESGKLDDLNEEEGKDLYRKIGLAALKYFMLKVGPKKRMLFNPEESIEFVGDTGPFIQYSYARIQSLLRKKTIESYEISDIHPLSIELIKVVYSFPEKLAEAGSNYDPSIIANYAFDLAKAFSKFYGDVPIIDNENKDITNFRLTLCNQVAKLIKLNLGLMGMEVVDRM